MAQIFLVDDEEEALAVLVDFLTDLGHNVHTAVDGEKAIELFSALQPDIVFLDLYMPKVDGVGVLQKLHEMGIHSEVVVMTGYNDTPHIRRQLEDHPISYFLEKPLDLLDIERIVNEIMARKKNMGL